MVSFCTVLTMNFQAQIPGIELASGAYLKAGGLSIVSLQVNAPLIGLQMAHNFIDCFDLVRIAGFGRHVCKGEGSGRIFQRF